jgi:hypothetical protein
MAAACLAGLLFVTPAAHAASEPASGSSSTAPAAGEATAPATATAASATTSPSGDPAAPPSDDLTYSREKYHYAATGLRDPFGSLVSGRFVSDDAKRLPDVGSVDLLGVMWGENDKFALVEDKEGNGFVLRVGDPVVNGEVAGITRESLSVRQHFFGSSTTITLKLKPREEKGHASKNKR